MTQHSAYHYTCDSAACGAISGICESSYQLPDDWTSIAIWKDGKTSSANLCPECTEALKDMMAAKGAVKLTEEYFK